MHDVFRGKDCMKKFCESLREQAMDITKVVLYWKMTKFSNF